MKTPSFAIFFTIVLAVYVTVNYYIFIRGWQAIPAGSPQRKLHLVIFLFLSLSFIVGRFLERLWESSVINIIIWVGSFWLAAMLYFFLIVVCLDFVRLANHWIPFFSSYITENYAGVKQITAYISAAIVVILIIIGHINAFTPRVCTLNLNISKKVEGSKKLKIAVATDIHLGTIVGRARLDYLVEKINAMQPDLVFFAGDIVDEDLGLAIRENFGEALRSIRAPLGVVAITGNHEYYAGVGNVCRYLTEHNIVVLRDSVIRIEGDISIVGREDREHRRFTGKKRKSLEELLAGVNKNFPVILLDHQPLNLEEAVQNGIDLQISGHTHDGQLWPFNIIAGFIYEVSSGYMRKEDTQIYISCGFGTWGPPVRLGNRPEIVEINLSFK